MKTEKFIAFIFEPTNPKNWLTDGRNFVKRVEAPTQDAAKLWREVSSEERDMTLGLGKYATKETEDERN